MFMLWHLMVVNYLQEEGNVHEAMNSSHSPVSVSDRCSMSVFVGTGNNIWSGLYAISSTLGFVILIYLLDIFYINPFGIISWWYKGLLFIICMLASVFIFGGLVVGLWHLWERRIAAREACEDDKIMHHNESIVAHSDSCQQNLASSTSTYYGSRPDFKGTSTNFIQIQTKRRMKKEGKKKKRRHLNNEVNLFYLYYTRGFLDPLSFVLLLGVGMGRAGRVWTDFSILPD